MSEFPFETSRVDGWETEADSKFRYFQSVDFSDGHGVKICGMQSESGTITEAWVQLDSSNDLDVPGVGRLIEALTAARSALAKLV